MKLNIEMGLSYIKCNNNDIYTVKKNKLIIKKGNEITTYLKKDIMDTEYIRGLPNGKAKIFLRDSSTIVIDDIIEGRVFDFLQSLLPKKINKASYDNTARGQNPMLQNIDHAEEIDELRTEMQKGHISMYEFEDLNPAYPKAGK